MGPLMMGCFKDEPKKCFFTGTWSVPDYLGNMLVQSLIGDVVYRILFQL